MRKVVQVEAVLCVLPELTTFLSKYIDAESTWMIEIT